MGKGSLTGVRVLVVEDELLVALNLESFLLEAGCEVIGPIGSLDAALAATDGADAPDAAVLDINLRGQQVYPVADRLTARGVPLVFCSGYTDANSLPERFDGYTKLGKPCGANEIIGALRRLLEDEAPPLTEAES